MSTTSENTETLDEVIDLVQRAMAQAEPGSKEFGKMVDQLSKLYALKPEKPRVKPETWATIGANLLGIGAILYHERAHVVATKAIGFVSKLR